MPTIEHYELIHEAYTHLIFLANPTSLKTLVMMKMMPLQSFYASCSNKYSNITRNGNTYGSWNKCHEIDDIEKMEIFSLK